MNLYLVIASTGEFSGHTQWEVAVYPEKEQAQQHADLANAWFKDLSKRGIYRWENEWKQETKSCPYDQLASQSQDEIHYSVEEIPFIRHVDEYTELPRPIPRNDHDEEAPYEEMQ